MRKLLKILAILVAILIVAVIGAYIWATMSANRVLAQTFAVHAYDFAIPFPVVRVGGGRRERIESRLQASDRAIERGKHLVESRYVCTECHGANFGGGTMIDAFPIGRLLGPNITTGKGSRTINYKPADWDRIVRHGVLPTGQPAVMPSEDFKLMSDQELSDVVAYIRSRPPVDNEVPAPSFGPLGKFLLATGQLRLSATSSIPIRARTRTSRPRRLSRWSSASTWPASASAVIARTWRRTDRRRRSQLGAGAQPHASPGRSREGDLRAVREVDARGGTAGRHAAEAADERAHAVRAADDRRRDAGTVGVSAIGAGSADARKMSARRGV